MDMDLDNNTTKKILIGPAEEEIRNLLFESGEPQEAIAKLQNTYGLDLVGIDDMYPLLDQCNYSRLQIHKACLDALNQAVVKRIQEPSFDLDDFHGLFERTFPYIHIPYMQPIPMALLQKFEKYVQDDIIEKLKANLAVFSNCPMNIKQRVWKQDESFFQSTMISILNDYHHNDELQNLAMNLKPGSIQEMIEERRSHPVVLRIMDTIGKDPQLYTMFIQMVRIVFETTPYPSLSSLRVDVLMNFHDLDVEKILDLDKCHQLIWSLDTCVRNQSMDDTIIEKIKECFDDVKNGTPLYGDFAMVLMDPMISNFLASCIAKWLRATVEDPHPDLDSMIDYSGKLLNLAEHAPRAIADSAKIPKMDKELKTVFWYALIHLISEEGQEGSLKETELNPILSLLQRSEIARKVFVHYLVDRVTEGDIHTLSRCLPLVLSTWPRLTAFDQEEQVAIYRLTYLSFVRTIIDIITKKYLVECITDVRWRQVVLEHFLLKVVAWDMRIHTAVIRMLTEYYLDPKTLIKLGPHIPYISEAANTMATNGFVDEKNPALARELYAFLIQRSQLLFNGEYRINAPAAMKFLHQF
ncbi:hypothetical protein K501DRAFT_240060 [Backusella circina FSU 941]|nr:hypothetical protein K501DRAFT_240060 [Backusella circina FSU 941]